MGGSSEKLGNAGSSTKCEIMTISINDISLPTFRRGGPGLQTDTFT